MENNIEKENKEQKQEVKIVEFKSVLYQKDGIIDASQLYEDIEKFIEEQKQRLNVTHLGRRHPLQHILNSTSGNYVSPTAMKSFMLCPASYLYSKLVPEPKGIATSVGTTFHTIMERFYNLDPEKRTRESIDKITEEVIVEDEQFEKADDVRAYVNGYWEAKDYETGKPMDHKKLICSNEVFIRPVINPLGVDLGVPIYVLLDRLDIRDNGICIVDYKTGFGDPEPYNLGEYGYLPQMIFYKWAVEAEYGQSPKEVMLCLPGASEEHKYVKMNVNSLVEQSKVVEQVYDFLKYARNTRETKQFEEKRMRYCNSCQLKTMCKTYFDYMELDSSNIPTEIPISIEILDKVYEDKS